MQIASRRSSLTTSNVALGRRQSVSDRGRAGAYLFKFGFPLSSASSLLLWKNAQLGFFLLVAAALAVLSASFARTVLLTIGTVIITLSIFFVVMQGGSATPWPWKVLPTLSSRCSRWLPWAPYASLPFSTVFGLHRSPP